MIADEADAGRIESRQFVLHPFKFLGQAEIAHVAEVNDKVYVAAGVDTVDRAAGFVVPSLRVADDGKAQAVAVGTLFLNQQYVLGVQSRLAVKPRVVGMIFYEVTASQQVQQRPAE